MSANLANMELRAIACAISNDSAAPRSPVRTRDPAASSAFPAARIASTLLLSSLGVDQYTAVKALSSRPSMSDAATSRRYSALSSTAGPVDGISGLFAEEAFFFVFFPSVSQRSGRPGSRQHPPGAAQRNPPGSCRGARWGPPVENGASRHRRDLEECVAPEGRSPTRHVTVNHAHLRFVAVLRYR